MPRSRDPGRIRRATHGLPHSFSFQSERAYRRPAPCRWPLQCRSEKVETNDSRETVLPQGRRYRKRRRRCLPWIHVSMLSPAYRRCEKHRGQIRVDFRGASRRYRAVGLFGRRERTRETHIGRLFPGRALSAGKQPCYQYRAPAPGPPFGPDWNPGQSPGQPHCRDRALRNIRGKALCDSRPSPSFPGRLSL